MEYFDDEPGSQEPGYFFCHSFPPFIIKTSEELFDRLRLGVSVEMVLSEFSRDARHVRRFPCEDVPILMDELDERAFLFVR